MVGWKRHNHTAKEIDDQGAIDSFNKNTLNSLVIDRNVIIMQLSQSTVQIEFEYTSLGFETREKKRQSVYQMLYHSQCLIKDQHNNN